MNPTFKQYTPKELYVPIPVAESLEAENEFDLLYVGYRPTGGAFFDTFLSNLYQHGKFDARYHGSLLGINYKDMCVAVFVNTGMTYTDFVNEYILLFADDLLKNRQTGMDLKNVAKRLGFTYSGFYHFMIRHRKWEKKRR